MGNTHQRRRRARADAAALGANVDQSAVGVTGWCDFVLPHLSVHCKRVSPVTRTANSLNVRGVRVRRRRASPGALLLHPGKHAAHCLQIPAAARRGQNRRGDVRVGKFWSSSLAAPDAIITAVTLFHAVIRCVEKHQ